MSALRSFSLPSLAASDVEDEPMPAPKKRRRRAGIVLDDKDGSANEDNA